MEQRSLEEISTLIAKATAANAARAEQQQAFAEIVQRFQDLAFGAAYAVLGDFHLAEDAAQESFLTAWRHLDQLRQPAAFPGWFKRIVLTQCNRLTRGKKLELVSLEAIVDVAAPAVGVDPHLAAEASEQRAEVAAAIQTLPEHERMVTALFYISDYSQNEIAAFLEVPVTTIKKRLFSARQRLRERMLTMVRETLHEKRPSRNEQFADTVALFNEALEAFVARVKQDRYIIAAILGGSLSHDTVWRKSDIDLVLVSREEKSQDNYCLVENGVNIHASILPRSRFKQLTEGSLQGSFWHSYLSLSTLLYTTDDSIRAYYQNIQTVGARDRQLQLMAAGSGAVGTLAKAEKWLYVRKDVTYSFLWLMYTLQRLAEIEVLSHSQVPRREVIPQAIKLNPTFFSQIYTDLVHGPKTEETIQRAIHLVNEYLDCKTYDLFGPVLDYLRDEGGIRSTTELDLYFRKQVQADWPLSNIYEWLTDKGIIQKVPSPVRLTQKSQVTVDEAAYYFDGQMIERN
ncbi:MAG TPA: sigma-70 family RNA polymerase sigma factor [Caldilineaceae bacterium]|nr:sigma-70 family RNA polymerase sigma factor [Caldilineaceae bacterium]